VSSPASAAAAPDRDVAFGERILDLLMTHYEADVPANCFALSPQFFGSEVNSISIQSMQGSFNSRFSNQVLDVSIFAAGILQKPQIGTLRLVIDALFYNEEKITTAPLDSLLDDGFGLARLNRFFKEGRKFPNQAHSKKSFPD
jgi:hypothetical protein